MLAQNLQGIQNASGVNISLDKGVGIFIGDALKYVYGIVGILLLIYFVMGGFQLMTSRGDPKAVAAAQAKITNALIGFLIILLSAAIVLILGRILHVEIFPQLFVAG